MVGNVDDGGPTFSVGYPTITNGMSLRDYFAAKAMGAIMVNAAANSEEERGEIAQLTARAAYMVADAMLAERGE